jgi:uncharacterized protein involved in outer membrane biogenesis
VTWIRSKRGILALVGLLLCGLFVVRPGADRLRMRIARSVGSALGRRVEISSASLRFLPRPGFNLQNFVVYDDPAFSAEPILRSDEVTASLRLTSLLHGRLEISRLSLTEPSLNLVRNNEGHWNLEYLVERSSKTLVAPTEKSKSETRPGFPYIEANRGRINFKFGFEKKQFALTEADFALFQDSENTWGVRLNAKPIRTDLNSSDTGLVKIAGSWQRAQSLHVTPLRFSFQWEKAQLGQASKLVYGSDKGWRGTAALSSEISGTPADLAITANGTVEDFRHYDVLGGSPLRLRAQCGGHYSSTAQSLTEIICQSPVGDGAVTLHGSAIVSLNSPVYHLAVAAQDVPLQALILLARHSKKELSNNLLAVGTVDGSIKVRREEKDGKRVWEGSAETSDLLLRSQTDNSALSVDKIRLAISPATPTRLVGQKHRGARPPQGQEMAKDRVEEDRVDVGPFTVALGGTSPATVRGWLSRSGYSLSLEGPAQLQRALNAARVIGIPTPRPVADGLVRLNLQSADTWSELKAPRVTGKAELRSVRAEVGGVNAPIEIDAAEILLGPEDVNVQNLAASIAGSKWNGSLAMPRHCLELAICQIQFNLHADEIATDDLDKLLNPQYAKAPWYRFLIASQGENNFLLTLRATGQVSADRVLIHKLSNTKVSARVEFDRGKLQLNDIRGTVLGGLNTGEWSADFTVMPPQYSGRGEFERVALGDLAAAMHDDWVSGRADATYNATASGSSAAELFSSATAIIKLEARDGSMPHIVLNGFSRPLQLRRFDANLVLRHKELDFDHAKLESPDGIYEVTGTASLGRALNLRLLRRGTDETGSFNIAGTLGAPVVSASRLPETQVALKP